MREIKMRAGSDGTQKDTTMELDVPGTAGSGPQAIGSNNVAVHAMGRKVDSFANMKELSPLPSFGKVQSFGMTPTHSGAAPQAAAGAAVQDSVRGSEGREGLYEC